MFLYYANTVFVCAALGILLLSFVLCCLLSIFRAVVGSTVKTDIYENRVVKVFNRYVLGVPWVIILLVLVILWSAQTQFMFNKITEYEFGPIEEATITGEWVKGRSIIRLQEDGAAYLDRRSAGTSYLADDSYYWRLDRSEPFANEPFVCLYGEDGEPVRKFRLFKFAGELRMSDNLRESGRIIGLGFKKRQ